MERFSVICFSLCSCAILAGSMSVESSTTKETLWGDAHDVRNVENHRADLLKQQDAQNNTKNHSFDDNLVKNATQIGEHAKNPLSLNKTSDASATSTGLSSHDILLDPVLIPARLSRQAEKGDYLNLASIENVSNDVESTNDENRSVVPSKQNLNLEGDLGVAEDRYQSPYPYWNSYYRGQFPNQRYQTNDWRQPYRSYWRYPVFSGK
ncbi:PREDICTED: uncharacterized protein LOC105569287 isoform X2 [Vollenhovia emeryi]|uniref:uncharacterized protein LOC105569287 isoform X2 n=1 Tax=Vollenhovia emeryi TaxID=411798 RepID=UPI0005F3B5A8|nr:PREDICTED: uncharacterized protein LOC105569287 isoform X2 [Vollenhovia emeryi]